MNKIMEERNAKREGTSKQTVRGVLLSERQIGSTTKSDSMCRG